MAKFEVRPNMQEQKAFIIEADNFHIEGGHVILYNTKDGKVSYGSRDSVATFAPGAWKMVTRVDANGA